MKDINVKKSIGYFSIFLGLSILFMWMHILFNETIPEGKIEMSFHLFSEFSMASLCLISGFLLIRNHPKGLMTNVIAQSMVLYSLINAIGYYSERDEKSLVSIFIFLVVLSFLILVYHLFFHGKF